MRATLVDLRYRTKDIMRAIERSETVEIFAHGKLKAEMKPVVQKSAHKQARYSVLDDPFFGSRKDDTEPVHDVVRRIREGRFGR